jgi:hypothetical protein
MTNLLDERIDRDQVRIGDMETDSGERYSTEPNTKV